MPFGKRKKRRKMRIDVTGGGSVSAYEKRALKKATSKRGQARTAAKMRTTITGGGNISEREYKRFMKAAGRDY